MRKSRKENNFPYDPSETVATDVPIQFADLVPGRIRAKSPQIKRISRSSWRVVEIGKL